MDNFDYEACGTCGCDHSYDWDYMSDEEREEAIEAHREAGDLAGA